ncbi:MAG: DUF2167 domain-containing protein [Methylobacillus sp.]|jgi:uncharacterized membrane-anchored protein|nr:DUF2167 domain-containing protein [Methylobacillus sp.]
MSLKELLVVLLAVPTFALAAPPAPAEPDAQDQNSASDEADADANAFAQLNWQAGPGAQHVVGKATLNLPDDKVLFIDEANSMKFLELSGNLPEAGNNIIYSTDDGWWAAFSFDESGYVKDDEKIDADALLKDLQSGDAEANKERQRLGMSALYTDSWFVPPHYDEKTKRLEWALKLRDDQGNNDINYTVRLLGRRGVMSATLVTSPETLDKDVAAFKQVLQGFDFNSGERYAEFKEGDHVAEYGLAALVAGGAVAVASKKGFLKIILAGIAAAFAAVVAFFKKMFGKKNEQA